MAKVNSRKVKALVLFTAIAFLFTNGATAIAALKTITCYKVVAVKQGPAVKRVTAVLPKCPTGYSRTKPRPTVSPTPKVSATTPATAAAIPLSGTYKGKLSIVWGDTYLQVTSVSGTGTGNILGLTNMTGSAAAAPSGICDTFDAKGSIGGDGNTLNVTFDASAKGCAADETVPTTIKITGNANITGGTGKYAGATGTLKVSGTFSVKGGASESALFVMDVAGTIKTK